MSSRVGQTSLATARRSLRQSAAAEDDAGRTLQAGQPDMFPICPGRTLQAALGHRNAKAVWAMRASAVSSQQLPQSQDRCWPKAQGQGSRSQNTRPKTAKATKAAHEGHAFQSPRFFGAFPKAFRRKGLWDGKLWERYQKNCLGIQKTGYAVPAVSRTASVAE